MNDFYQSLAGRLKEARIGAGIKSAASMAQKLGISSHTYRTYERAGQPNARSIPLHLLPAFSDITNVNLTWLITGSYDESRIYWSELETALCRSFRELSTVNQYAVLGLAKSL